MRQFQIHTPSDSSIKSDMQSFECESPDTKGIPPFESLLDNKTMPLILNSGSNSNESAFLLKKLRNPSVPDDFEYKDVEVEDLDDYDSIAEQKLEVTNLAKLI
jgi:hypothetical protein